MNQTKDASSVFHPVQAGPETAACERFKTSDLSEHFLRVWQGDARRPVLVYLHGIEGHGRWFENTALALKEEGFTIYAADRRGAGMSAGRRGHLASWRRLLSDIEELLDTVSRHHADQDIFLMANCWGAKAAIALASLPERFSFVLSGLILTSPAVCLKVDVNFATKLKIAWAYLTGSLQTFPIPLSVEHFTDNPQYLSYIAADRLRLKEATASFFVESLKLTRLSLRATRHLSLPVLVLQSGKDSIVDLDGTKNWFAGIAAADKTLTIFPAAHHSLDFERDPAHYLQTLTDWLNSHSQESLIRRS